MTRVIDITEDEMESACLALIDLETWLDDPQRVWYGNHSCWQRSRVIDDLRLGFPTKALTILRRLAEMQFVSNHLGTVCTEDGKYKVRVVRIDVGNILRTLRARGLEVETPPVQTRPRKSQLMICKGCQKPTDPSRRTKCLWCKAPMSRFTEGTDLLTFPLG